MSQIRLQVKLGFQLTQIHPFQARLPWIPYFECCYACKQFPVRTSYKLFSRISQVRLPVVSVSTHLYGSPADQAVKLSGSSFRDALTFLTGKT